MVGGPVRPRCFRDSCKTQVQIIINKNDDPEADETIEADHYKPPIDQATQMERHNTVRGEGIERFAHGWQQEADIADKYGCYQKQFLDTLS